MTKILDTLLLPQLTADTRTFFGMSSLIKTGLKHTSGTVKNKIEKFLNEPLYRVSDLGKKYRTINYLETTGLIDDPRDKKGVGWRNLGLSEYIYISILLELRQYGLKSDHLKQFKNLYEEYSTYAIYAVLAGHEVTMIFKPNGFCAFLDPTFLGIYEEEDQFFSETTPKRGSGEIQLKLSHFTAHALELIGKPIPVIEHTFARSVSASPEAEQMKDYEKEILATINKMKHDDGSKLSIKRLKNDALLLEYAEKVSVDSDIASSLSSLVDEDFCNLNFVKRDGKAVNLERIRTEKIITN